MNPILASSLPMKKFLDPENYTAPLHGKFNKLINNLTKRKTNLMFNMQQERN